MIRSLFLILLITASQTVLSQNARLRPNIIYIYADDLGYGEIGAYGQQKIKTPNLDRLARQGMKFTQHYSSAPVCAPARAMLLTGKHAGHSYIRGNYELGGFADSLEGGQMPLPEGTFTLPRMLQKAGYKTGMTGKWGLGMHNTTGSPLKQGFDFYYGYLDQKQAHNFYPTHLWENGIWDSLSNPLIDVHPKIDSTKFHDKDFAKFVGTEYAPEKMTAKALDFIDANKKHPFFLYVPYTLPHVSLQAPGKYVNRYVGLFKEQPYYAQRGYVPSKYPLATYAAMITYLDEQVGIIMDQIHDLGLDDNTLIMFSSDNGATFNGGVEARFFNSVDGLRGLKMDVFEGGIRVPFIASWPGKIKAGSTSELVSVQYDLLATVAELTGQIVENTDGVSFLPELMGNSDAQQKREFIYFEYPEKGGQIAIRAGDWKGVKLNLIKNPSAQWMVFNLKSDRNETNDVASMHPELITLFNQIVKREHQPSHIKEWEFIAPKFDRKSE